MSIKVLRISEGEAPTIFGLERLPPSFREPARKIINKYAQWMTLCQPYHLGMLSQLVIRQADNLDTHIDGELLLDFHQAAEANRPGLGATLYRLDESLLPV